MIISCINCNKKFEVNSDLIPNEGRNIQCGSCNHIWFFKKEQKKIFEENEIIKVENDFDIDTYIKPKQETKKLPKKNLKPHLNNKKSSELVKYETVSKFSFSNFLSYILVFLISFIGLIVLVDTFKSPLFDLFPNLELILFNFYEVLKDIQLFIKDLF